MNPQQITAILLCFTYVITRFVILISQLIEKGGNTQNLNFILSHGRYSSIHKFGSELVLDVFLLLVCIIFLIIAFSGNIISFSLQKIRHTNKDITSDIEAELVQRIKLFNDFHLDYDISFLQKSSTQNLFNKYYPVIIDWKHKQMKKIIQVYKTRKLRYLKYDQINKEIWVLSFEYRVDYLKYKDRPLKRQDTSSSWDYMQYQFLKENGEWKLNYFEKDPSDKELLSYLFKK